MFQHKHKLTLIILLISCLHIFAQQVSDSLKEERFTIHGQSTCINQYKPSFSAKYSGTNSLLTHSETQLSTTFTAFFGVKLWNGASAYLNPEIAGGAGLSSSLGVGASTNGETYRIDNPSPAFELARLYFKQIISLNKETEYHESSQNVLSGRIPTHYISLTVGKICVADIFDLNSYSHDPRTQFMSWALMSNGAWDFPANTRGYTPSIVLEWVTPKNELRYGFSLLPTTANGMNMNWDINNAGSHTLEYTHNYSLLSKKGILRMVSYLNYGNMGNYNESLTQNSKSPNIITNRRYGRTKYGFGINAEQAINNNLGAFMRLGWGNGKNETWAFTEIDHSVSLGLSLKGGSWKRPSDIIGLAHVISGLSTPHINYLKAGGKGFELGDGNLNYTLEQLAEIYYSLQMTKSISLSGAYQFIMNPGYNNDRGPVNVFSARLHFQI